VIDERHALVSEVADDQVPVAQQQAGAPGVAAPGVVAPGDPTA